MGLSARSVSTKRLFWNDDPVILILPTKDLQGGNKKYVGGNSWILGPKLCKAQTAFNDPDTVRVTIDTDKGILYNTVKLHLKLPHSTMPN
jgi:hypothetical protein